MSTSLLTLSPAATRRRIIPATLLRRIAVPAAIIALWYGLTANGYFSPQTMPTPLAVAQSFWQLIVTGQLWPNLLISLQRVVRGLCFGVSAGVVLGLTASLSRFGEDAIDATI